MTDPRWADVDRYATDLLVHPVPALEAALAAADAAGLPSIAVSPPQGKFLMLLAQSIGARRILEIGTLAGYSAMWLAQALPADGRLITLEVDLRHAAIASANFVRGGYGDRAEVRVGPAADTLRAMVHDREEPFDFVFIDADKPAYATYLALVVALSRVGTLIVADNIVRKGAVIEPNHEDVRVHCVRPFNEAVARDARLDATLVQTVGTKGYDGFTLARVVSRE